MIFNPDPSKQAQEVVFSRKLQKSFYPPLHFNNIAVTQSTTQKAGFSRASQEHIQ